MKYVYVKDSEGYVSKKLESEILSGDTVITEKQYEKISGIKYYKKKFSHGGVRENAGRKLKFSQPLEFQIRVTQEEKAFLDYARKNNINLSSIMQSM